jgi:hypothetical protein
VSGTNRPPESETEAQAKRDLARISREGEALGGTAMDNATPRPSSNDDDAIERLGKKIGRGLAFAVVPFVIWYFGRSAGWW